MRRKNNQLAVASLSAALVLSTSQGGFSAAPQVAATGTLVVTVVDPSNKPIVDLDADDFVVEENGRPREVLSAYVADYPIVLVIDPGGSAEEDAAVREAARRFLRRAGEGRAIAVATADAEPSVLVAFDADRAQALATLSRPLSRAPAPSRPLTAAAFASRVLEQLEAPFAAVVVAWNAGAGESMVDDSPDTLSTLFSTTASVHVVARQEAPDGVLSGDAAVLRNVAGRTSGSFTVIYAIGSYAAALDGIADRFATEMMVQYLAAPDRGTRPSVRAGVRIPGARVTRIRVF